MSPARPTSAERHAALEQRMPHVESGLLRMAKPLPPVQRPGVSQAKGAAQDALVQNLSKRFDASGSLKDAAALVRARRAAR
jgi:hypothetical protein